MNLSQTNLNQLQSDKNIKLINFSLEIKSTEIFKRFFIICILNLVIKFFKQKNQILKKIKMGSYFSKMVSTKN